MPDDRTNLRFHPLRDRLIAEVHARPATPLTYPATVTRLATLSGPEGAAEDRAHMTRLCDKLGAPPPGPAVSWHAIDLGSWQLRWERHTEFSTWTFVTAAAADGPFQRNAMASAPAEWLAGLPGEALVATQIDLHDAELHDGPDGRFASGSVGSTTRESAAIYADFRTDAAGFTRFLALAWIDDAAALGRIVLSLLEIETYRLMALLAFPLAGEAGAEIAQLEAEAARLADALSEDDSASDRDLLEQLAQLAARAEALRARTGFRFGAARAYHRLVEDRIAGLAEQQIMGCQTLGEFMHRRLVPAMRTCDSTGERLDEVVDRIARTEQLLNTRVEVAAEATSLALLKSMDERAGAQLKLQRTVEGLSVAAISYYAVGLLMFLVEAVAPRLAGTDLSIAKAVVTVLTVLIVWLLLRRLRSKILV